MEDKKEKIKVGSIVKKSYTSSRKPSKYEKTKNKETLFLPCAGVVVEKHYDISLQTDLCKIDWFEYTVPELDAVSDPWEFADNMKFGKVQTIISLKLFQPYYESMRKRRLAQKKK